MAKTYKKKLKSYEDMRGDLAAERALNREMRKRLSGIRHELRSAKARLNDLAHFVAVSRGGSIQRSNGLDDMGDTDMQR
tara:strand:+ start:607 stop:843 length:237 start_codon:yes stop_codon:yes gene_type:complete